MLYLLVIEIGSIRYLGNIPKSKINIHILEDSLSNCLEQSLYLKTQFLESLIISERFDLIIIPDGMNPNRILILKTEITTFSRKSKEILRTNTTSIFFELVFKQLCSNSFLFQYSRKMISCILLIIFIIFNKYFCQRCKNQSRWKGIEPWVYFIYKIKHRNP